MANPEYVLEMQGIVKMFPGVRALDGVNLRVRPGKVHVICGENGAGKSTLMKIINGTYVADEGTMTYKGKQIGPHTVTDTLKMGIAMIYQELNPIAEMTIAENIWLGREPRKGMFVDYAKMYADTQALLNRLDMPYQARQKMYELSIAGHQLVEIAKAISVNASVIIMDEPSSAIGDEEIEILFKQIFSLREQGVAILYITHKMDEIFRIADEITIIRDGQWIETGPASDYDPDKLVARMVGREITNVFPKDTTVPIGDVILDVKNLTQAKEDGHMQGEYMADVLPEGANILYCAGTAGLQHSAERRQGFLAALEEKGRSDISVLADQDGDYVKDEAMRICDAWIQTYSDGAGGVNFNAIVCANDQMALGCMESLKGAGIPDGSVLISGVDGTDEAIAAVASGTMAQTILQDAPGQGSACFEAIQKLDAGESVDKEIIVPFQSITADNVADYQ